MITLRNVPKFVRLAAATRSEQRQSTKPRLYLSAVYVQAATAVATNGHRMHVALLRKAVPEPLLLPVDRIARGQKPQAFPHWAQAVPELSGRCISIAAGELRRRLPRGSKHVACTVGADSLVIVADEGARSPRPTAAGYLTIGFETRYLRDAVAFLDAGTEVTLRFRDNRPGGEFAVVMPYRL